MEGGGQLKQLEVLLGWRGVVLCDASGPIDTRYSPDELGLVDRSTLAARTRGKHTSHIRNTTSPRQTHRHPADVSSCDERSIFSSAATSQGGALYPFCERCVINGVLSACCGCGKPFAMLAESRKSLHRRRTAEADNTRAVPLCSACEHDPAVAYCCDCGDPLHSSPKRRSMSPKRIIPSRGHQRESHCDVCPPDLKYMAKKSIRGVAGVCSACPDMRFCSEHCCARYHRHPRLRQHLMEQRQLRRGTGKVTKDALPTSLWEAMVGGEQMECGECSKRRDAVVVSEKGHAVCGRCVQKRCNPAWGRLKLLLRRCEHCDEAECRPALFHCSPCKLSLCAHCWAFVHANTRHTPTNPYTRETCLLLHACPSFKPYVRYVSEASGTAVPQVAFSFHATDIHCISYLALALLDFVPNCLKEDEWTRANKEFPLV